MQDDILNTFRYVVGASFPLRLSVSRGVGRPPDVIEIPQPYALIGNGSGCHVRLEGEGTRFRHAYLQVLGGRVACIVLPSAPAPDWEGLECEPWLSPEHRLNFGENCVQLFDDGWISERSLVSPLDYRARSGQRPEYGILPEVELEIVNGKSKGTVLPINRIITLIGRDSGCRITCGDPSVSRVHASLLLAPSGLWVIDLMGRNGIEINGSRVECGYLADGSELQVGKYIFRARYAVETVPQKQVGQRAQGSAGFLTRQHQVFPVAEEGDVLIVCPQGDIKEFFYQDIHLESNRIVHLLQAHKYRSVVIDYSGARLLGSIVLDAVATICRTARDGATQCCAGPDLSGLLETTKFNSIWPYYPTRAEAVHAVMHMSQNPVP